jgi:hypothetical protein
VSRGQTVLIGNVDPASLGIAELEAAGSNQYGTAAGDEEVVQRGRRTPDRLHATAVP